ncbi:MAG: translesion error-prone DNA polymerase V autoproteolytic subunit [Fibrobacterales bacterium]
MDVFKPLRRSTVRLPLLLSAVQAGFPSPADDYIEKRLDLNDYLMANPTATYYMRVAGDSMEEAGIHHDDLLVVDCSLKPRNRDIVVAVLNGEFTVKRLRIYRQRYSLVPENPNYPVIEITEEMEFRIWGVVSHVVHATRS